MPRGPGDRKDIAKLVEEEFLGTEIEVLIDNQAFFLRQLAVILPRDGKKLILDFVVTSVELNKELLE